MKKTVIFAVMVTMIMISGCGNNNKKAADIPAVVEEAAVVSELSDGTGEAEDYAKAEEEVIIEDEIDPAEEDFSEDGPDPEEEHETEADKQHEEILAELAGTVEKFREDKDINHAFQAVCFACDENPGDEELLKIKQEIADQFPGYVGEDNIINKKSCKIENEWLTGVNGEKYSADFNINLGGGSLSLTLGEKYSMINLRAMLTEQSPTKAKVDIDVYADGELIYSLADFNTSEGVADIWLNVEGVDTLIIDSADHDHAWVGEASFSKPDSACHYSLTMYEERDLEWVI